MGDLVEKAAESGVYIELANDINIADEYPDGDMSKLDISSGTQIDGKNKKISNWNKAYVNDNTVCVGNDYSNDYTSQIKNLTFANINLPSGVSFIKYACGRGGIYPDHFFNCKFYGKMYKRFITGARTYFKQCSFNIEQKETATGNIFSDFDGIYFNNCYVKMKWACAAYPLFSNFNGPCGSDSYFELEGAVNLLSEYNNRSVLNNCVLDIRTNSSVDTGSNPGVDMSIYNSTHAPNIVQSANFKGVTDANWLDTDYLSSIGFNAG